MSGMRSAGERSRKLMLAVFFCNAAAALVFVRERLVLVIRPQVVHPLHGVQLSRVNEC